MRVGVIAEESPSAARGRRRGSSCVQTTKEKEKDAQTRQRWGAGDEEASRIPYLYPTRFPPRLHAVRSFPPSPLPLPRSPSAPYRPSPVTPLPPSLFLSPSGSTPATAVVTAPARFPFRSPPSLPQLLPIFTALPIPLAATLAPVPVTARARSRRRRSARLPPPRSPSYSSPPTPSTLPPPTPLHRSSSTLLIPSLASHVLPHLLLPPHPPPTSPRISSSSLSIYAAQTHTPTPTPTNTPATNVPTRVHPHLLLSHLSLSPLTPPPFEE